MGGLRFRARGTRQRVVLRLGLSLRERPLHENVDDPAVLGVHADRAAVLPRAEESAEDRRVVEHEDAGVGHEELEGGHALRDERVHLPLDGVVQVGDDHVEAVVDRRLAVRLRPPRVERVTERLPAVLDREVDDGGRAAVRRGDRARLEVVGGRRAPERHVEVGVDVDPAGEDVLALSFDDTVRGLIPEGGQIPPRCDNRHDLVVLDQDVTAVEVRRRDDRSAADEGLQVAISAIGR